jgi:hypothetical protein
MWGSAVVYLGLVLTGAGLALIVKPIPRWRVPTRVRAAVVAATGVAIAVAGVELPAFESRAARIDTRLDEFVPAWQFREVHSIRVSAPPARVFEAIKRVRADEIVLFQTLTWIRRGGRELPPSILNAGGDTPLLDVATSGGFVMLADDPPREVLVATLVVRPSGQRFALTPDFFRKPLPDGFAVAAMNFLVQADGRDRTLVTTETRVFASGRPAQRQFAAYWRVIYPGSALIRRMWLRAIRRRATGSTPNSQLPTPKLLTVGRLRRSSVSFGSPSGFAQLPPDLNGPAAQLASEPERFPLDDAVGFDDDEAGALRAVEDRRAALDAVFREPPQRGDLQASEVQARAPCSGILYPVAFDGEHVR